MQNKEEQKQSKEPHKSRIAEREEEILKFWRDNRIFEKSLEKPAPKGSYVFYDGPPYATGLPHFGHVLPTTIKDAVPRFRTMQGYRVLRRWGWDCHGLPIENLIEKELGLATKKDIENFGIEKFNNAARASVLRYADQWKEIIPRLGRWVDMEHDYRTMDSTYTESVWWSFKKLEERELVYKSFKVMYICPRCETTLSNFEVNQGYKDISDLSVYAKFELADEPGTYFLAWTTTPWTLPGNVALAVGPEIKYSKVLFRGEQFWVATNLLTKIFPLGDGVDRTYVVENDILGKELVKRGYNYNPLFDYYAHDDKLKNRENGWKVYAADFVTTEDGTGIVHIAPAFGSDDYELLERENLPFVQHVSMNGTFKPEVTDFAGMHVKPKSVDEKERFVADIAVIKYLQDHGSFFAKEKITHSYPHCWRCDTPLLNYATSSWFVKVTAIKDKLLAANQTVRWVPAEIGEGRFGKWLEGARDWAVSRSRYWGAPIPVWACEQCEASEFIGSLDELAARAGRGNCFTVVRHGESENLVRGATSSDDSVPSHLTEKGRKDVRAAAQALAKKNISAIYASPMIRTKETAEIIAEALGFDASKIVFDDRLREVQTGMYNNKPSAEYHGFFENEAARFDRAPEGAETLDDLKTRVGDFLYDINARHRGENILIVSHQDTIWMLSAAAACFDREKTLTLKNDGVYLEPAQAKEIDFKVLPHNECYELDMHRPYIDDISFPCACGGVMRRVPEVFDVWYDSGSMPYAQNHYPFQNKELFEQKGSPLFPADFIAEGLDQTRGWFYTLMVLNTALYGRSPYKSVTVNGLILAEDGRKMSKSLKNYPDLMETVDRFGADSLRYFLISSPAVRAEEVAFSEKGLDEVVKKIILRLENVVSFYEMYKTDEGTESDSDVGSIAASPHILDRWILARLHETAQAVTEGLSKLELDRASRPLASFVDDLSTWYLRRSRERFKSDDPSDAARARGTTRRVLIDFAKLMAPFMPFAAEDVYRKLGGSKESVHLEDWPEPEKPDRKILDQMEIARQVVEAALALRAEAGVKVRQPLAKLVYSVPEKRPSLSEEFEDLIADELNVKEVAAGNVQETPAEPGAFGIKVELDTKLTPELEEEGNVREFIRAVQDMRKKADLNPSDRIALIIVADEKNRAFIEKNRETLSKAVLAREIRFDEGGDGADIRLERLAFRARIETV